MKFTFSFFSKISFIGLFVFFTFFQTGCGEIYKTDRIDAQFDVISNQLNLPTAQKIKSVKLDLQNFITESKVVSELISLSENPTSYKNLDSKKLLNQLGRFLNQLDSKANQLLQIAYDQSYKAYYEKNEYQKSKYAISAQMALLYYKQLCSTLLKISTVFTFSLAQENLAETDNVFQARKFILEKYSSYMGAIFIINNDLQDLYKMTSLETLKKLDPEYIKMLLPNRQSASNLASKKLLDHLKKNQKIAFARELVDYFSRIKERSFIFSIEKKVGLLTNTLSWVGNLTFGLVNTAIGVGIVLAAVAVSPVSETVDFPTFAISRSGKQIYVDVSGMGPMAGKMSMGLFEFDNYAGYEFASGHEGGHALQSALTGPLYLPLVLLSYMIFGFDQGFIEDWAWAWADVSPI